MRKKKHRMQANLNITITSFFLKIKSDNITKEAYFRYKKNNENVLY